LCLCSFSGEEEDDEDKEEDDEDEEEDDEDEEEDDEDEEEEKSTSKSSSHCGGDRCSRWGRSLIFFFFWRFVTAYNYSLSLKKGVGEQINGELFLNSAEHHGRTD